jgi:hypothetical protein
MINRRLALGGLAAAAAGPALAVPARKSSGPPVELPLQISRGLPWTSVELPDGRSFPFGLMTARRQWAAHPSVTNPDYVPGKNSGGSQLERVVIGGKLKDTAVPCLDSPGIFEGMPVAGLIGLPRYHPVLLDWDRKAMTVHTPVPAGYRKLPMDGTAGTYGCVKVFIDGRMARLWVAHFLPWGMHLTSGFVRRTGLRDTYARRRDDFDGEGKLLHQSVIAERVTVAGLELNNAVVRLNADDSRYDRYMNVSADGAIGFDLLKRLNMHVARPSVLEFHVAHSSLKDDPYLDDRAGMAFTDYGGALTVTRVDEKGPAFKAGVRRGDVVIDAEVEASVEGLPYALTQPAGAEVPLDILRGETRKRIVVTLEDRL